MLTHGDSATLYLHTLLCIHHPGSLLKRCCRTYLFSARPIHKTDAWDLGLLADKPS